LSLSLVAGNLFVKAEGLMSHRTIFQVSVFQTFGVSWRDQSVFPCALLLIAIRMQLWFVANVSRNKCVVTTRLQHVGKNTLK